MHQVGRRDCEHADAALSVAAVDVEGREPREAALHINEDGDEAGADGRAYVGHDVTTLQISNARVGVAAKRLRPLPKVINVAAKDVLEDVHFGLGVLRRTPAKDGALSCSHIDRSEDSVPWRLERRRRRREARAEKGGRERKEHAC